MLPSLEALLCWVYIIMILQYVFIIRSILARGDSYFIINDYHYFFKAAYRLLNITRK